METWYAALAKLQTALLSADDKSDAALLKCYRQAVRLHKQAPRVSPLPPCYDTCYSLWPGARTNQDVRALVLAMRTSEVTPHLIDLVALRPPGAPASSETLCSLVPHPCNTAAKRDVAEEWRAETAALVEFALRLLRGRVFHTWLSQLPAPLDDVDRVRDDVALALAPQASFASAILTFYRHTPDDGVLEDAARQSVTGEETLVTLVDKALQPVLDTLPAQWQTPTKTAEARARMLVFWASALKNGWVKGKP